MESYRVCENGDDDALVLLANLLSPMAMTTLSRAFAVTQFIHLLATGVGAGGLVLTKLAVSPVMRSLSASEYTRVQQGFIRCFALSMPPFYGASLAAACVALALTYRSSSGASGWYVACILLMVA